MNRFKLPVIPITLIIAGVLLLVMMAVQTNLGSSDDSSPEKNEKIYRNGVQRVLHDFGAKESEEIAEHKKINYYKISDNLWIYENLAKDQADEDRIWMGKMEENVLGFGSICGEYLTDGAMSAPYYQEPYYYSFGSWKPDAIKDEFAASNDGPFRTLNVKTGEMFFNVDKTEFFALGLPYLLENKVDIEKIKLNSPRIRIAPEACMTRVASSYILIFLGVIGAVIQYAWWRLKRKA